MMFVYTSNSLCLHFHPHLAGAAGALYLWRAPKPFDCTGWTCELYISDYAVSSYTNIPLPPPIPGTSFVIGVASNGDVGHPISLYADNAGCSASQQ
jgi:hypothetical protein